MASETKSSFSDLHKVLAFLAVILTIVGGLISILVVVIGVLWGYFSLQRDTADNKTAISRVEQRFDVSVDEFKKQLREGQEKQSKDFSDYAKRADDRTAATEKEIRRIDASGTEYGRTKVDTRMQEIAEVKTRVEKVESAFADLRPIIQRTGDRVEQMWGDYNTRPPANLSRSDLRKMSKN